MVRKSLGLLCCVCGVLVLGLAVDRSADAQPCNPKENPVSTCARAHERPNFDPVLERSCSRNFENKCVPIEGSICNESDMGWGGVVPGVCNYSVDSIDYRCRLDATTTVVTLHHWRSVCTAVGESNCRCKFEAITDGDSENITVCDCQTIDAP